MPEIKEIQTQDSARKYGPKATLAQCLATIAQSFLFIRLGMNISISVIVIHDLYRNLNSEFSITTTEASWYGSLLFIAHLVGCLLSGILQDKFGKKSCMILANVPSIFGYVLLYSAHSSVLLCASTLLMGFSAGSTSSYVGEISEPRLRGSLGSLGRTAMRIGTLLMYNVHPGTVFRLEDRGIAHHVLPHYMHMFHHFHSGVTRLVDPKAKMIRPKRPCVG
ncbi:unnamed protein product [Macrosiphum euphorbiae]|uniref:Major facilitator superfamily (MFS) profile domain-containing protein n=1 Tax=Macrosiphum euphorbiae TaxID=13131 RepID=A0AAV0X5H1_9HEMI|nr:unnamed protein product [Macrosiphum euphorbiae]